MQDKPNLRPLDFQSVIYQDQQMWLIRDPLELSSYQLILTPALAQMLALCDGTRSSTEIQSDFYQNFGVRINSEVVEETLTRLNEACLLDNERSRQAIQDQLQMYQAQPYRPPSLAGLGYSADPDELDAEFEAFAMDDILDGWQPWTGRGVISPHIDYHRGGPVYAKVWRRAEAAVKQADLVLIFGTDHNGSPGKVTLTQTPYATPYGVMPTDLILVSQLANALGPDVFEEELHHRKEHSVELSAVWLHHVRKDDLCPVVPILCGSFHHYIWNDNHPSEDPRLTTFIDRLRTLTTGKKVLAVASVDLAHVGPNFGDDFIMDTQRRVQLTKSDKNLMEAIGKGDAERFYQQVAAVEDQNRICGFSSIYLMLRFLGSTKGIEVAYEHCPADTQNASLVSICGMLLS